MSERDSFTRLAHSPTLRLVMSAFISGCTVVGGFYVWEANHPTTAQAEQIAKAEVTIQVKPTRTEIMDLQHSVRVLQMREVIRARARRDASRDSVRYDSEVLLLGIFDGEISNGIPEYEAAQHAMAAHCP